MFHPESAPHDHEAREREAVVLAHEAEPEEEPRTEADPRAVEIAGGGAYEKIAATLCAEGLIEKEEERVEREYALDAIPFIGERDREMFTILDLYDPETARHCLETYRIAREKVEKEIFPGVSLARLFEQQENVSLEEFYRACLFHDIGKVEVPRAVIRHRMDESHILECLHHVYHSLYSEHKIPGWLGLGEDATDAEIDDALAHQHALRCVHLVPAREALSPEDLAEVKRFGYTGEETLMDIIKTHEAHSGMILASAGERVEALLAAHHHNYGSEKLEKPFAVGVLHMSVDLADLLHIADVTQALSAERAYKKGFSMPKVMRIIAEHAEHGKVSLLAAYLWLSDELRDYEATTAPPRAEDEPHLTAVRTFLEAARRELGTIAS
jgi:hypothetical protein